jgi:hypothetical protein
VHSDLSFFLSTSIALPHIGSLQHYLLHTLQ